MERGRNRRPEEQAAGAPEAEPMSESLASIRGSLIRISEKADLIRELCEEYDGQVDVPTQRNLSEIRDLERRVAAILVEFEQLQGTFR